MDTRQHARRLLTVLLAASLAAGSALAGPPPWAGGGHKGGGDDDRREHGHKGGRDGGKEVVVVRQGAYFSDRNRESVHSYYRTNCPPGLAKKHNGCMPPGQAKKVWVVGQPLPPTVVIAPPPQQILVSLPPPPVNHRYVQVAGDILLIAIGSKMVVDGINGLTR